MEKLNLQIFMSPFLHETRAIKFARSILKARLATSVEFAALGDETLPQFEKLQEAVFVRRFRLSSRKLPKNLLVQLFKYVEWCARIIICYRKKQLSFVVAHSLEALLPALILSKLKRVPLHYDAHELESERNGVSGIRKVLAANFERRMIRFVDSQTVVSGQIADWYQSHYNIQRPTVVRNIPEKKTIQQNNKNQNLIREAASIRDDVLVYLYLGAIAPGRGIDLITKTFAKIPEDKATVVFMGPKPDTWQPPQNVHWLPPVPPDDVVTWARTADVGLAMIENTCLSYYYSLPNKLFEYLLAGVPVVASPFPEMRQLVEHYSAGWFAANGDELSELVDRLDDRDIREARIGAQSAAQELSWENEEQALIETLHRALSQPGRT